MSELQKWTIDGEWLVGELFRMTAQGRVVCFHQDAEDELQRLREENELLQRAVEWLKSQIEFDDDGTAEAKPIVPPPELAPCILGERE